jgi:hypothetical protein
MSNNPYHIVDITDHKNLEIQSLYRKLNEVQTSYEQLEKNFEKIKSENEKQLTEIKKINTEKLCIKILGKIIATLIIISLLMPFLLGHGYMTEMIFTNKSLENYVYWQTFLMKLAIVGFWFRFLVDIVYIIFK